MKDFARVLLLLLAFSTGGLALGYAKAIANGWAFDWFSAPSAVAFGVVIGGAVLCPFLAWQDRATRTQTPENAPNQ
jgi:hypothetical protein